MYDKKECGKRLKELRMLSGKTQLEVSQEINISTDTISKIEQGKRSPSVSLVEELSRYYKISTDYIITGSSNGSGRDEERDQKIETEQQKTVKRIIAELEQFLT